MSVFSDTAEWKAKWNPNFRDAAPKRCCAKCFYGRVTFAVNDYCDPWCETYFCSIAPRSDMELHKRHETDVCDNFKARNKEDAK